jgi:hypothetical protein
LPLKCDIASKKSGTETSNDLDITITTKSGKSSVSSKVDYYYKGKKYTVDSWANNIMEIVKDNPDAVAEIKKYRTKTVTGTSLGIVSVGFVIPPTIQFLNNRKINIVYASIALVSGISASITLNRRNRNIEKAAEYFNNSTASLPNIRNREPEFCNLFCFKFNF